MQSTVLVAVLTAGLMAGIALPLVVSILLFRVPLGGNKLDNSDLPYMDL